MSRVDLLLPHPALLLQTSLAYFMASKLVPYINGMYLSTDAN